MDYQTFCLTGYKTRFDLLCQQGEDPIDAQRNAIRDTSIAAIKQFPMVEPTEIWKQIYVAHVYNKSNLNDRRIIDAVISADNSWKKSSGHAFEELIKEVGNLHLKAHGIELLLQKELNILLKANEIANEDRDISWLKEQIKTNIFDLYLLVEQDGLKYVFGCVQSKTSIRDREPSINAMKAFFMSIAIVLDGAFLKLPKFINMVNGNSTEYQVNGWHALYILTNDGTGEGRIHKIGVDMDKLVEHCIKGAKFWLTQRQWLDHKWSPTSL